MRGETRSAVPILEVETMNILVVSGHQKDRDLIKKCLTKRDDIHRILEAESGTDAVRLMTDDAISLDCALIDYSLPDCDSIAVLRRVFDEDTYLCPCPVIMMIRGDEAAVVDALRYGVQDYLLKDNLSSQTCDLALIKARQVYDLKQARNEAFKFLEHSQKMEVIGQLTGGIAHDFNNLLTIIFGNTRLLSGLLQEESIDAETCLECVSMIQDTTRRGADLVKRLSVFARQQTLTPVTTNMNRLVENLESLLVRSLWDFVEIETDLAADIYPANLDIGQFENAVINLAVNARDAMLDGGRIVITTRNVTVSDEQARTLDVPAGDYVVLTVSDNGAGMNKDMIGHIFEPFYTTKEVGRGSGLGLSTVYSFVRQSHGAVTVDSMPGEGSTFRLYFPHATQTEQIVPADQGTDDDIADDRDITGNQDKTILVVEDEDEIRFLATMLLEGEGYRVLEAANGNEAFAVLKQEDQDIDLLFTDIAMPGGMNGVQVAARMQTVMPDIKLLFTSGYAARSLPDMSLIDNYPMIDKPYRPQDLIVKIRETLAGKTGGG